MSSFPVIFDDGSRALVAPDKLAAALKDGGQLGYMMQFDDGSKALVPHDKVHDAIRDGGMLMGAPPQALKPQMQGESENFAEKVGAEQAEKFTDDYRHIRPIIQQLANEVYSVSAPNIADQLYKHLRGQPNTLKDLPPKMVLGFLAAGGLGEGELAAETKAVTKATPTESAAAKEPTASAATATPQLATQVAEKADPLLERLRQIAADIQRQDAEEATAKKPPRASKVQTPVVPESDEDMLRLLKKSLKQAKAKNAS